MSKTVLIVAGETSGDKHAARLVEIIKKRKISKSLGLVATR